MQSTNANGSSKSMLWTGRILSALAVLFLLMDGVMKLFKPSFVVQASAKMGYPESSLFGIGLALVVSTVVYVTPRTSIFGALLLTGYLGGAVASNVRINAAFFNIAFPLVFAVFIWGGLWLRDSRLRSLLPLTVEASPARAGSRPNLFANTHL